MTTHAAPRAPAALIVDDDPLMRLLARETLTVAGFAVAESASGEEALARFAEALPDIVLLDVDMPGLDGFTVCRRMRAVADAARLPIVMVTGLDDVASIERAYESGATDFIVKPINWTILAHRVRYILRGATTLRDLRDAETRQAAMLQAIPDMIFRLDTHGRFLDYKPGVDIVPMVPQEQFLGRPIEAVLPPPAGAALAAAAREAGQTGETQTVRYALQMPTGLCHYEARFARVGAEVLVLVRDVTEAREHERRIAELAYSDALTGLPNRQAFVDNLDSEIARAAAEHQQVGVLFLDLDGFKRINDTLGHVAGDRLLQALADRLRRELRASDVVARAAGEHGGTGCARLGGDEFTVLVPHVRDARTVMQVADRLRELVAKPFSVDDREIVVTASLGVAFYPDDGADAATLLKHADTAMYHAKDAGRNNCQPYRAALTTRARVRFEIEADMRSALERGQFTLHFQPQVRAADGRIVSVEALVRWNHPERGRIAPIDFIPLAEENGFIVPLGAFVLRRACAAARRWRDAGLPAVRVAVNVSGRQLRDADFVDDVLGALRAAGQDGSLLELELTESVLMDTSVATVSRMRELRQAGVHFSIDDFGTGFSSMSYLKRYPIGTLKIDRSFVRGLPAQPDDAAIVCAVLSLAHSLGLDVVAEGVETQEQQRYLVRSGCDKLQGYLFSAPVPADAIESMLLAQAYGVPAGPAASGSVAYVRPPADGGLVLDAPSRERA